MGRTDVTVEPPSRDAPDTADRSLSRRKMIRAAGIAGAAAWTAPVIVDSLASPAAAITCPEGNFAYVVLYSPPGSAGQLFDRPGNDFSGGSGPGPGGTCTFTGPGADCLHSNPAAVRSSAADIGLIIVPTNISHNITQLAQAPVVLTLAADSCCVITNVKAHVHRFGAATGQTPPNDCPDTYCQPATTNGPYLQLTAGAYNTRSVTVRPNLNTNACDNPNQQVHWGSPNQDSDCQAAAGANGYANGQPFGYMLIELNCTGQF
jgi:hypothetical protein